MDEIFSTITSQVLPHWPFLLVVVIFAVIGQVMSKNVFTRERAYKVRKASSFYKFWESQGFWWWGRETLPLHSIASTSLLGFVWRNPENAVPAWGLAAGIGYFAGAGAVSLFAWALAKGFLKKRGIDLDLPGVTSDPPPSSYRVLAKPTDVGDSTS